MVLIVQEEHIGLINHEALQLTQINWLSATQQCLKLTVRRYHNLCRLSIVHGVTDCDARALTQFLVHRRNLITKLSDIHNTDYLNGGQIAVNAQG